MQERILEVTVKYFQKFRPILVLLFAVTGLVGAEQAAKLYKVPAGQPLTKLVSVSYPVSDIKPNSGKVSITGAIKAPGVYQYKDSMLVQDLISAAGGFAKSADLGYIAQKINLAETLAVGEQVYIPFISEQKLKSATSTNSGTTQVAGKLNLNTASETELETLPGVGPTTAQKIIAARPYSKLEDLLNVPGIGDVTFAKLKDLLTL